MNEMRKWFIGIVIIILIVLIASTNSNVSTQEIANIKNSKSTQEQTVELTKLLDRIGPVKAQEDMLKSGLPFTGETHLLIHVIGNYIYNKYGLEGLPLCRDYFLSACYHGFIINALADYGLDGVAQAMDKCSEAGPGVAPQCAHATGHGFLAWHDYDLLKALKTCDELGEKVKNFGYFNCYDGVFMENVWGVHGGKPSEKRWVKQEDIYYPCTDERIPEKYLSGCWSNQATLIYQHYKGDLRKTAEACDKVENEEYKNTCYNNFARQIHPLTEGKVEKVFSLCANATGKDRQDECVLTNMTAYWSVGDRTLPQKICDRLSGEINSECNLRLRSMVETIK